MTVALVPPNLEVIKDLETKLLDTATNLQEKYRILFSLRNVAGTEAHSAMVKGLQDVSALFRHEVAYCLGQRQDVAALDVLEALLSDQNEHPMVRHEAAEALGAIGTEDCLARISQHLQDPTQEVAETCQLALQRIQWLSEHPEASDKESPYYSVDPTPAMPASTDMATLKEVMLDESKTMFERYSALFALRNKGGPEAVAVLGEVFNCSSSMLKHEVAYVLGQMQDPSALAILTRVLKDPKEAAMVRHEAAESLGSIAAPECLQLLRDHTQDAEPIVADSCVVALDMLEFEHSGKFQYATLKA